MSVTVSVNASEVVVGLGELRAGVANTATMLRIIGELMRASIARTFREEGSPAGAWPQLAESTLEKKQYVADHKLLIMSGRLYSSIGYVVQDNTLTIGTNVVYAAVHQYGSKDRLGGSIGSQARIAGREVIVKKHLSRRFTGIAHMVPEHERFQNIPSRPYLVFRPEDPQRIVNGIEAYLSAKAARIGKTTGGAA